MLPECKHGRLRRRLAAVFLVLSSLSIPAPAMAASDDLVTTDVTFKNGPVTLQGTVITPADTGRRWPGLVLIAGAGARSRDSYRAEAEAFARAGTAVLIYDKRADYSRATSSFADLADDAVAGVRLLRTRADVQPRKVGVWGHSEGGWVAPLAASRSGAVDFVVVAGATALTADRTQLWSNRTYLTHAGVKPSLQAPIGVNVSRMLVAAGLFGDVGNTPVAALEKVRQPLLALFAEYDRSTPPGESMRLFREALTRGGNNHYKLSVVRGADHNMRSSTTGFDQPETAFAPAYLDTVTRWIATLADQSPPTSDEPPAQTLPTEPVRPPAWYEAPALHVTLTMLLLLAFAGFLVTGLFPNKLRRAPRTVRRLAVLAALGGLVSVLGTSAYLFWIVATGATDVGSAFLGRPPLWLLLQALTVAVLVAGVILVLRRREPGVGGMRFPLLLIAGVLFVPWAAYWGLLTV
ncbi:alpha/beta hydrolase [Nonomuraea sp. WAC 01424]|uniref:alpha/beta hydrolase family protein n=1 Tax=Nonomuraea sp. WAC 01424 TaxID=2203200 RepID=UPI000F790FBB|nr:acyl-CoA thioester hydrolase/BAAT C-terminal domain-containing protein [Nonomuraea sp. WAC 01424]RSN02037.1 alpha/beta hydrolase [Nonomuraea sp. WAC 01424]